MHPRELHAERDHLLRSVCDGEQHPCAPRGRLDVKPQREVSKEESREVVLSHLATGGVWPKDVGWPHVGVIDLGDLLGQRVPEELQQPDLLSSTVWGCWWRWGSSQWWLKAAQ